MSYRIVDLRGKLPVHPTRKYEKRTLIDTIVLHCTASDNQDPFKTARYDITPGPNNHISKKGAPGLTYHDYIIKDGVVYHCNDYELSTWHATLYNKRSIGVVMAYKALPKEKPTPEQYESMLKHITLLCLYFKILPKAVLGHRELPWMVKLLQNGTKQYRKECPGMAIDLDKVRKEITTRLQLRLANEGLYTEEVDGLWGPKSQAALLAFDPRDKLR